MQMTAQTDGQVGGNEYCDVVVDACEAFVTWPNLHAVHITMKGRLLLLLLVLLPSDVTSCQCGLTSVRWKKGAKEHPHPFL
jgi:hypothetical protein